MSAKPRAVILARISSDHQATDNNTLDLQVRECTHKIKSSGWELCHEPFKLIESGSSDKRNQFVGVLEFCKNRQNKVDYLVVREITRFTRQGSEVYFAVKKELEEAKVQLVDCGGIIQAKTNKFSDRYGQNYAYKFADYSPSETQERHEAEKGKEYLRDQLGKMIGAEIEYLREGWWVHGKAYGFNNIKIETEYGKKTVLTPNSDAEAIIKIFEMRTEGYDDQEIAQKINELGFKTAPMKRRDPNTGRAIAEIGNKPFSAKIVQRAVARPIYADIICEKWTDFQPLKANFDGLVDIKTFNLANKGKVRIHELGLNQYKITYNDKETPEKPSYSRNNPDFLYRGLVICPICRENGKIRPLTASFSRGKLVVNSAHIIVTVNMSKSTNATA